jgi:U3 small nucleolar ribonucleoprotein protein IMP4
MLSRKLKERKDYIKQREESENLNKKDQLMNALNTNSKIPHHLRSEAKGLLNEVIYNTKEEEIYHPFPKIAVTTSHSPSSVLNSFSKHFSLIFNGFHLMRGRMTEKDLSEYCKTHEITHLYILRETKGNLSSIVFCKYPQGPTYHFSTFNVKYQRRLKSMGEKAYLVIDGMDSTLGKALKLNTSLCFPKVEEASRLVSLINKDGTIAFRHFLIENKKLVKECEFDMKLFKVVNSTFETNGDVDFTLKSFMNSANNDILKEKVTEL